MKAENVTNQRDPEFFVAMTARTAAWLNYYSADLDAEQHPVRRNLRTARRYQKIAEKAESEYRSLAAERGYTI